MKLWRRLAKKEKTGEFDSINNIHTGEVLAKVPVIKRNGRDIRYQIYMGEQIAKQNKRSYPLLDSLLERSGMKFVLSKKQQDVLQEMVAKAAEEQVNETE